MNVEQLEDRTSQRKYDQDIWIEICETLCLKFGIDVDTLYNILKTVFPAFGDRSKNGLNKYEMFLDMPHHIFWREAVRGINRCLQQQ